MSKSAKALRILFLGSQMEVAGAQRMLLSQARWFEARGHEVRAVFFYDKQGLAERWQAEHSFPLRSLKAWRYRAFAPANYWRALGGLWRLWKELRQGVDVLVSYTPHSNVLGLPVAWLAGTPVRLPTHHGYIEGSSRLLARVHGWMVNTGLAGKLVAVSAQVREEALAREGVHAEKIEVIENGIEPLAREALTVQERKALRDELGVTEGGWLLLTVGRLTVQKGHSVLLKAIQQVAKQFPQALFAFAGDGYQRQALEAEAQELGVQEQVRFLGVREDVAALLLAADVFVQPSLWEGLSLAMLEALLAGTPVLATRVEGVVDVIESGQSGLLVEVGEAEALAEAIIGLLSDEKKRKGLGRAGKRKAEAHYSVERMCQEYEDLIFSLMPERSIAGE